MNPIPGAQPDPHAAAVTRLLNEASAGNPRAAADLLPLVYERLRSMAGRKMRQERSDQTLQATALVHEAYVRLVDTTRVQHWDGRWHFFAAAAEAMRRILVDNARRRRRPKHGGDRQRVDLQEACSLADSGGADADMLLAVDAALSKLAAAEPAKAELVKLRYFAGLSLEEAAELLGISLATAKRHWAYARAWLYEALCDRDGASARP